MLRVQSSTVSRVAAAAAPLVQRRHYEYWGMHTTPRAQPGTLGDKLPTTLNLQGQAAVDVEGQMLTGNGHNAAWSTELLTDKVAENEIFKMKHRYFNGIDKWVLDDITPDECDTVTAIYGKYNKAEWWQHLFRRFPALRKPFDDATQKEWESFFGEMIAVAHDEAAATAIAKDFTLKMFETKQIQPHYYWRIAESLMDTMEDNHRATASFTGREYGSRALRVVIERAVKITLNTPNDWNFASDDFVNPMNNDVGGIRATHEAGYW